jgi:hypothetical protein
LNIGMVTKVTLRSGVEASGFADSLLCDAEALGDIGDIHAELE